MQIAHTAQMQAKAPGQLKAAKAAADSLLSPEDFQKQRNKDKNKNLRDRQKLLKLIAEAERQIEGWRHEHAKLTFATPRKKPPPPQDTPPHKDATLSACTTCGTPIAGTPAPSTPARGSPAKAPSSSPDDAPKPAAQKKGRTGSTGSGAAVLSKKTVSSIHQKAAVRG